MNASTQINSALTTTILRETNRLAAIADEWDNLYQQSPRAIPFQRREWILAWIEAFAPRNLIVIQVHDEHDLVGLAPLLIYSRGPDHILAFAGGGVSDYLGLLAETGREQEVLKAILQCINDIPDWNLLELTDINRESSLLTSKKLKPYVQEHNTCSVLPLPSTEAELLKILSDKQRANLRNARSRLQRAGGAHVELARGDTLTEFLEDLFRLHTARWANRGGPGVLNDENTRKFHRLCSPELLAAGILRLYRLRVRETTVAVLYSLWGSETVYCYLQGFEPEASFLSPGTYLMYEALKDAVHHGMRRFDFLRGQESYKQHWRAQPEFTHCVQLQRNELSILAT